VLDKTKRVSRIHGFHKLSPAERLEAVAAFANLDRVHRAQLAAPDNLDALLTEHMIEMARPSEVIIVEVEARAGRGEEQHLDGADTGDRADFDEIRFSIGKRSETPQLYMLGEINHQSAAEGGFSQDLGVMGRIFYAF
jgi:hypothetical protein